MPLSSGEINKLGRVLMAKLTDLGIQHKCRIAAKAGMDISQVPNIQSNPPVDNALHKPSANYLQKRSQLPYR